MQSEQADGLPDGAAPVQPDSPAGYMACSLSRLMVCRMVLPLSSWLLMAALMGSRRPSCSNAEFSFSRLLRAAFLLLSFMPGR